jgi:hypothetical protein
MFKRLKKNDLDGILTTISESQGAKSFNQFFQDRLKPHLVGKFITQIKSATDEKKLFEAKAKLQLLDDIEHFLKDMESRQEKVRSQI